MEYYTPTELEVRAQLDKTIHRLGTSLGDPAQVMAAEDAVYLERQLFMYLFRKGLHPDAITQLLKDSQALPLDEVQVRLKGALPSGIYSVVIQEVQKEAFDKVVRYLVSRYAASVE